MQFRYIVSLAILLMMTFNVAASQAPVTATSSIEGIVVKRGTNEPIANVDLELSRVEGTTAAPLGRGVAEAFASILYSTAQGLPAQGATPPPILAPEVKYTKTGANGRFAFKDLKEGKYRLVAIQGGGTYYPVEYGQHDLRQRGLNFPIAAGQAKNDVKLEMTLTGAISGRVVDEDGLPMGHAVVMALTVQYSGGEPRSYIERIAITDERGDYRIYWLEPSRYFMASINEDPQRRTINTSPISPPGRTVQRYRATSPVVTHQNFPDGSVIEEAYGLVYYAGTTDVRARTSVEVHAGETSTGVDIPMGVGKTRTHHIRGIVINGETGQPAASADLLAIPREWSPNALVLTGTTNAKGEFDLGGARPESYILSADVSATVTTAGTVTGPVPAGAQIVGAYTRSVGYVPVDMG
ncbi:MAG TPA: carboxypeptidase-like regulatory domain-containing protein, partial [Terriglobia bacterium]|nr:carboxypeptidase-like regulatory domain-containing protein [Terriglobia bacterium]